MSPRHALYSAPEIYDIVFSWDPATEREFYRSIFRNKLRGVKGHGTRIVEFGSGTGRILRMLSQLGFLGFGVDVSREMSNYAHKKRATRKVDVVVADMVRVPAKSGSFSGAICTLSSINYLAKRDLVLHLKETKRVLAKSGVYLIDFAMSPEVGTPVKKREEWDIVHHGTRYRIHWDIRPKNGRSRRFVERITVKSGSSRILLSESETTIHRRAEFEAAVENAGLHIEHWFKPFVSKPLRKAPAEGRVIAVCRNDVSQHFFF